MSISREGLGESVRVFERFNQKEPHKLVTVSLDFSKPLVYIGRVPEIHYKSRREGGREKHYYHVVERPGKLYAHPDGDFMILVGGSTVIGQELEENPQRAKRRKRRV